MSNTDMQRAVEVAIISNTPTEDLPQPHWTTNQLQEEFSVLGFIAPYIVVQRKSDGKTGTLQFKHSPRIYFNWQED